ncbi:MAG: hypothetical protein NVSMB64_12090 [Candidatus Velthaea sp.]
MVCLTVSACGGGSTGGPAGLAVPHPMSGVAAAGGPVFAPAGTPVSVGVTVDAARGTAQTLTPDAGGTLLVTGADGTRYSLEVPPGALSSATRVTLAPIAAISGSPLGGLKNGVQFGPEGLVLNTDATLTIKPAVPIPLAQFVGFGYTQQGTQFHLEPATGNSASIVMAIRHFSGVGDANATPSQVTQMVQQHPPSSPADDVSQKVAALDSELHGGQISSAQFNAQVGQLVTPYYDANIKPKMIAGLDSDAAFTSGAQAGLSFLRQLEILGIAPDQVAIIGPEIESLLKQGMLNALSRAYAQCSTQHNYGVIVKIIAAERQAQILGYKPAEIDYTKLAPCVIFNVVSTPSTATIGVDGTQLFGLDLENAQHQLLVGAQSVQFNWASGDASVAAVSAAGGQQADAIGLKEGTTTITPSIASSAYTATSLGIGTLHTAGSSLTVHPDCKGYLEVKNWTANAVASYAHSLTRTTGFVTDKYTVAHNLNVAFHISGGGGSGTSGVWNGSATGGHASVADKFVEVIGTGSAVETATASGLGSGAAISTFLLRIDANACTYDMQAVMAADVKYVTESTTYTTNSFYDLIRAYHGAIPPGPAGRRPSAFGSSTTLPAEYLGTNTHNSYFPGLGLGAPMLGGGVAGAPAGTAAVSWTLTPGT